MLRISLSLASNAAVLVLISVVFRLFGIDGLLPQNGVDLNLNALLIMSVVIGFGGLFISLALSKWMAKRTMGVHIIGPSADRFEHQASDLFTGEKNLRGKWVKVIATVRDSHWSAEPAECIGVTTDSYWRRVDRRIHCRWVGLPADVGPDDSPSRIIQCIMRIGMRVCARARKTQHLDAREHRRM